jgi:hypothetical protein
LLPARELAGEVAQPVPQTDRVDHAIEPGSIEVASRDVERERDVLCGRERGHQVVGLEDEPDPVPPQPCQLAFGQAGQLDVADEDVTTRRGIQPGHAVQERGLARARGAHDRRELARREVHRDAAECFDRGISTAVHLPKIDRPRSGDRNVRGHGGVLLSRHSRGAYVTRVNGS